jgi:chromate transporter
MAFVTWELGRAALVDHLTVALAVAGGVVLLRSDINSAWLVLAGGAVGLIATAAGLP